MLIAEEPETDLPLEADRDVGLDPKERETAVAAPGLRRLGWTALGLACVALGGIGVVVPGLPTTIFFISAAACFSKSSPRLEAWVLSLPKVGPAIRDHRAGLGMSARAKAWAIGTIVVMVGLSVVLIDAWLIRLVVVAVAAVGVTVIARQPTKRDANDADLDHG